MSQHLQGPFRPFALTFCGLSPILRAIGQRAHLTPTTVFLIMHRWEIDSTYCRDILKSYPIDTYSLILDMIDAAVFDYLIGNADRHQYETFEADGDHGMLLLLDNAKR